LKDAITPLNFNLKRNLLYQNAVNFIMHRQIKVPPKQLQYQGYWCCCYWCNGDFENTKISCIHAPVFQFKNCQAFVFQET